MIYSLVARPTYNILIALGKEADFLYFTVDTYIDEAKKDDRQPLVEIWNQMKRDKEKHLQMLRDLTRLQLGQQKYTSFPSTLDLN
ncbi:MAG: hypothetical protein M3Y53_03070 [Thermoproteota archaeon]|nr:hypothetical protein [Thermoproteota archaeon]